MNEKFCILIQSSLKFVRKGPIDNNPVLASIMAWRWIGDNPLSEPKLTQFSDVYVALGRDELRLIKSPQSGVTFMFSVRVRRRNDFCFSHQNGLS